MAFIGCAQSRLSHESDASRSTTPQLEPVATSEIDAAESSHPLEVTPPQLGLLDSVRGGHLLDAVVHNNAELAADLLLPREAYRSGWDDAHPGKVWEKQIHIPFKKEIGKKHRQTKRWDQAQLISFELGSSIAQIPQKPKGWKQNCWRVRNSKLTFRINGTIRQLPIAEMTSWKGSWYITKLR